MLHILLIILKVIGIILAVALGIVIVSLLCILLVPVRYKIEAYKKEDIWALGRIRWLCSILYVKILYEEDKFGIQIRIFGHTFYDSNSEKVPKRKSLSDNKDKKLIRKDKKTLIENKKSSIDKTDSIKDKKASIEEKANPKKRNQNSTNRKKEIPDKKDPIIKEESSQVAKTRLLNNLSKNESGRTDRILDAKHTDKSITLPREDNNSESLQVKKISTKIEKIENIDPDNQVERDETKEEDVKINNKSDKASIFTKLKNLYITVKEKCKNLIEAFRNFKTTFQNIRAKLSKILNILKEDRIKSGLKVGLKSLLKALKYLYPKKLHVNVKYGTGDPCSTGQILAGISLLYPIYKEDIQVFPYFEDKIFEFDLTAIGRIRMISLLIICIKLIRDKNFRYLLSNIQNMKEEL